VTSDRAPFEVERELGTGATGRVHLARLTQPLGGLAAGTAVALKRLREELLDDPQAREAFELETRVGSALSHPGVTRVLSAGTDRHGPWMAQPFVPGETLAEHLAAGEPVPEPRVRALAAQLAGGLAALHASGWAHGDVKPENMRLDERGRAVLLDLGFAAPLTKAAARRGVRQSGSLAWLSPERARGASPSAASDVFALGMVLYQAATGCHPFDDARRRASEGPAGTGRGSSGMLLRGSLRPGADRLLAALTAARTVPPSRLVPQLSPFFDALLAEMLARDPAQRPTAAQVAARFEEGEVCDWWRAQVESGGPGRTDAAGLPDSAHLLPLVGRERELALLAEAWERVRDPEHPDHAGGSAVLLTGPEGSGKSRLTSEFAARARRATQPPAYLYGRCSALELQRPCASVLRLLQRWLLLPPGKPPGERELERIARIVPPATAATLAGALTTELEGEVETAVPVALAAWLEALARSSPLIVFLDDLNFADEGTLATLTTLAERLAGVRALLILGERAGEPPALPGPYQRVRERLTALPGASELPLGALELEAVREIVERLFHHSAPILRLADVLWSRSRGNPGLLGEILRDQLQRGRLVPHSPGESGLMLIGAPEDLPLPESLSAQIVERARSLSANERRWLQRLAVVGGRIDTDFLARAFEVADGLELERVLARLVATGWLVPAADRYRFARPALREAVYRAIPEARRVRLHALAARALAPRTGDEPAARRLSLDDALQRAFHLRAAGEDAKLLGLLEPLVEALLRRGQPGRVHTLARWGLEALDRLKATRARARQRLRFLEIAADAADRLGRREEQRRWLDTLSDLDFSPERDTLELARVYLLHGRFAAGTGQYGLARGMFRNAVALIEPVQGADELHSEGLRRLAAVQIHIGELGEAQPLVERAIELAQHPPQEALARLQLASIELLEDRLEPALREVDRAMRLLRQDSEWKLPGAHAAAHLLRGRIYRQAGRPRRALGALQHALRLAEQAGERRLEQEAGARLGGLLLDLDRPLDAEARLREALHVAEEIEDRRGRALAGLWLGILLWEQGDDEGERLIESTLRLATEVGLGRVEAVALAVLARSALVRGELDQARALSTTSLERLEANGAELADRILIVGTHAAVLHEGGGDAQAAERVRDLRRRMRREHERIENPVLRRRHRAASTRLLESALRPERRVWPRAELVGAEP
jgi:tetratricopeptide (TPR) repeat protein